MSEWEPTDHEMRATMLRLAARDDLSDFDRKVIGWCQRQNHPIRYDALDELAALIPRFVTQGADGPGATITLVCDYDDDGNLVAVSWMDAAPFRRRRWWHW